jgi:hypothetical protein
VQQKKYCLSAYIHHAITLEQRFSDQMWFRILTLCGCRKGQAIARAAALHAMADPSSGARANPSVISTSKYATVPREAIVEI